MPPYEKLEGKVDALISLMLVSIAIKLFFWIVVLYAILH